MLAKALLSVVGLLFAGSLVSAQCVPTYTDAVGDVPASCSPDPINCISGSDGYYEASSHLVELKSDGTVCDIVTTPGFYKAKNSKFYSVNVGGAATDVTSNDSANCAAAGAGKFINDNLCLDGDNDHTLELGDGKTYLFEGSNSLFGEGNVVLKSTENSVVKDTAFNEANNYDYCVNDNMVIFADRKKGLCDNGNNNCAYYHCTNGACTVSNKNVRRQSNTCDNTSVCTTMSNGDGYYIVITDDEDYTLETSNTFGDLYHCSGSTCTKQDQNNIPLGYVVNKGNDANNHYIKCEIDSDTRKCKPLDLSSDGTCDVVGLLYRNTGINYLCVGTSGTKIGVNLTSSINSQYMASITSSLFGIEAQPNHFIVLDVDGLGNVTVVKVSDTGRNAIRYRYTDENSGNKFKIVARSDAPSLDSATGNPGSKPQICHASGEAIEYMLDQWNLDDDTNADYYVEFTV